MYQGSQAEGFDAQVFADGSVAFGEPGAFHVRVDTLCVGVVCPVVSPARAKAAKKPSRQDRQRAKRRAVTRSIATRIAVGVLTAAVVSAGSDDSGDMGPGGYKGPFYAAMASPGARAVGIFHASGRFGRHGGLTAQKQDFLSRTRSFRLELAVTAQESAMQKALDRLSGQLKAIEQQSLPGHVGRARLARIWREFDAQHPEPELQSALADRLSKETRAKQSFARRQILAFARRMYPQASENAYSASELKEINAGYNEPDHFLPYAR